MPADKDLALETWVKVLDDIYYPSKNYERTEYQLFAHLVEQLAGVTEFAVKSFDGVALGRYLARMFAWVIAICIKIGETNVAEIIWHKFPYACFYCGVCPCSCRAKKALPNHEKLRDLRINNRGIRPTTVDGWQRMFREIYESKNAADYTLQTDLAPTLFSPDDDPKEHLRKRVLVNVVRLVGEVGELAKAVRYRHFERNECRDEIADMVAWIFTTCNLIAWDPSSRDFRLADALWALYPEQCGRCDSRPCRCTGAPAEDLIRVGEQMFDRERDQLTGVGSQKAWLRFLDIADRSMESRKALAPYSVIYLDLNDFKSINEHTKGAHDQGNAVLQQFGGVLKHAENMNVLPFRSGGDEFTIVCRGVDALGAAKLWEQIRRALESERYRDIRGDGPLRITASGGIATSARGDETMSDIVSHAEANQKNAKAEYRRGERAPQRW